MNKKIMRIGAAALAVTTLAGGVFAGSYVKELQASFKVKDVLVDGQTTQFTDVNGKVIEPFIVDGTTYVPARGLAESLDKNVSWDGANVIIGDDTDEPKYVFMFIGDGLSHVQSQMANYYLDATSQDAVAPLAQDDIEEVGKRDPKAILKSEPQLSYMDFDVAGITTTYDSTSFCPDSASTASSIATGHKTHSGSISVGEDLVTEYATMAEQAKDKGMKVGIVSSVTINHATPAAFYAHNYSRDNYYAIGQDLVESGFDYFAGGAVNKHDNKGTETSIYTLAEQAGYTVVNGDQAAAEKLTAADGKILLTAEDCNGGALPYEVDRKANMWALSDYVAKGIEVLDNDNGFFMMCEAGKIDWACHANDAFAAIGDTIAFSDAIQEAVDFYNQHPNETLIVVTGDHETGGMTIGYAGTKYDTFLAQLDSQKGSYDVIAATMETRTEEKASFSTVMADIEAFCGLTQTAGKTLSLTEYEVAKLQAAYDAQIGGATVDKNEYGAIYGGYDPLPVTVMHIMNNKSGVDFTSFSHTGVTVGTFAKGVGAEQLDGFYDNTDIYNAVADIMNLK